LLVFLAGSQVDADLDVLAVDDVIAEDGVVIAEDGVVIAENDVVIAENDVFCVVSSDDEVAVVNVEVLADVDDDPVARDDLVARGDIVVSDDFVFVCEVVAVGTADTGPPTHSGTADPGSVSRRPVSLSHVRLLAGILLYILLFVCTHGYLVE